MNHTVSKSSGFLYTTILKPVFFAFDPESVHNLMVRFGTQLGRVRLTRWLLKSLWAYEHPSLVTQLNGVTFPNPIGLSAGFDYNGELTDVLPALGFGFHTIGTITLHPYAGNPRPRLVRLPRSQALLVNKGLKNRGARAIIANLKKRPFTIPVGISIASTNQHFANEKAQLNDITTCFKLFEKSPLNHAYYELNISCPNTFGGEPFTTPSKLARLMVQMDKLKLQRPLFVKMPIDQGRAETLALLKTLARHKVQGVIFGNLTKDKANPAVHPDDRKTWLRHKGNVSGQPTRARSTQLIRLTRRQFGHRFTIIGTGGIFTAEDAREKLAAGADLLQLITGLIYKGPQVIGAINAELAEHRPRRRVTVSRVKN